MSEIRRKDMFGLLRRRRLISRGLGVDCLGEVKRRRPVREVLER